jgi:hypothetical protein
MKKQIAPATNSFLRGLTMIIFLSISTISFAQKRVQSKTSELQTDVTKPTFGVRAGVLSSGIRGEASGNLDNLLSLGNGMFTTANHTGFYAGAYASIPMTTGLSIEPGLFYSQKGYEINGDITIKGAGFLGANAKAKLESEYLDIPVLLKAELGSGFQLFAGPQFSYLMKANLKSTAGILGINLLNSTLDATEQFNRWDMGLTGGIGYKLSNGININAAYDYGLSKLDKNQNTKAYNYAIKIGVGIQL